MSPLDFVRQFVMGISSGMVTFLMAAGMSLVMSGMNIINFGQGAFFILGAFLCFSLTAATNFWWALVLAPLIVAVLGGLAEFLLRPLYGKSILYQLLSPWESPLSLSTASGPYGANRSGPSWFRTS